MRRAVLTGALVVLLIGPTVLAFFTGGYFDGPRAWAGSLAWLLVAIAVVVEPAAIPRGRTAWLAIGGLAALAGWTLLSIVWAPLAGSAYHPGQIVVLYTGVLLAAAMLLRSAVVRKVVEPALAAGLLIVICYGLSERLLPGLLHFSRSLSAHGRLEQPLTYWNAMGEAAALGFVLCARLAGDISRHIALRTVAAAAAAPLGAGVYLSVSRGALFACAAGLVILIVLAPRRQQLHAILLALGAGALAVAATAPFGGVTSLTGSLPDRERDGAIALVLLVLIAVGASLGQVALARRPQRDLRLPQPAGWIALGVICAGLALAIVFGATEKSTRLSYGAGRYESLQSNRYAYWGVAMRAFGDEPIRGVGAGGWAVYWLRYRSIKESAQDAHSLPIQTLAELGLVGLLLLGTFLTGVGLAARDAYRAAPAAAAGPAAGFAVWVAHAPLDWDWQMPAVTVVAMVLAGALVAIAGGSRRRERPQSDSAIRGASRLNTQTASAHTAA